MPDTQSQPGSAAAGAAEALDAVIVGAGLAGLYMLHRLRGRGLSARIYEAGGGLGGTWYWNRYPGARCDVESMEYSYQFDENLQQEWEWTERYATQPEILRYMNHVADRFDLSRGIQFNARVTSAVFDGASGRWAIETSDGAQVSAAFCIMATGCLSATNLPDVKGIDDFRGATYHTGRWPHAEVDLTGLKVGVIGTGSSAVQVIPLIAEQAAHLHVFQRTPNFSVPAHNAPLDPQRVYEIKKNYAEIRRQAKQTPAGLLTRPNGAKVSEVGPEERQRVFEERWAIGGVGFMDAFADVRTDEEANETAAEFVRGKIREIVRDPDVAAILLPRTVIGCKRLCVDSNYFAAFNRPNVTLVDVSGTPIEEITPVGLRVNGREHEFDAIVFATGYDALTGALTRIDIRGRNGQALCDKWAEGPRTYLGLAMAGFPNLFTITGPGSPSVLTNMVPSIEHHVEWISDCIGSMREQGVLHIEPTGEAEAEWVAHNRETAEGRLLSRCASWYVGANVPGKPRVYMPYFGGQPHYMQICERVAAKGYEGFTLS